jgi:IMP dehydrogenase
VEETGYRTIPITDDGTGSGKLLGMITSWSYRPEKDRKNTKVKKFMTPFVQLTTGSKELSLEQANELSWQNQLNVLPIVDENQHLVSLVFRKDCENHKKNPLELCDENKALLVGAAVHTRDYEKRVDALVAAGVNVLCIDSSHGNTAWQVATLKYVMRKYPDMPIIGGNVETADGFKRLVNAGARAVKVGMGGGRSCKTRDVMGEGVGQATAIQMVAKARDKYFKKTGKYIPICSDGAIVENWHIAAALGFGADYVMAGGFLAGCDEAPGEKVLINGKWMKMYWGEASNYSLLQNSDSGGRYYTGEKNSTGGKKRLKVIEEGVAGHVDYKGPLQDVFSGVSDVVRKIMCDQGALTISQFHKKACLMLHSEQSNQEGHPHDMIVKQ